MSIEFKKISQFQQGTLYRLLCAAYAYDRRYQNKDDLNWREADRFFYDNPAIADSCGFITVFEKEAIGFACWDPRNLPACAEIGHNCISSGYKGRGYGKLQLREALKRIRERGPEKIIVTTNTDLIPARHMYESVGFTAVRTWKSEYFEHIDYELYLCDKTGE